MPETTWLSSYLNVFGTHLGGAAVNTGDGAQTTLTICDDLRGIDSLILTYRWINASAGTQRRLFLDFNAGDVTGSGSGNSIDNANITANQFTQSNGRLDITSQNIVSGIAYIDAPASGIKMLAYMGTGGESPYDGAADNVTWRHGSIIFNDPGVVFSTMRVRATDSSDIDGAYIGEGSRFDVYGLKATAIS